MFFSVGSLRLGDPTARATNENAAAGASRSAALYVPSPLEEALLRDASLERRLHFDSARLRPEMMPILFDVAAQEGKLAGLTEPEFYSARGMSVALNSGHYDHLRALVDARPGCALFDVESTYRMLQLQFPDDRELIAKLSACRPDALVTRYHQLTAAMRRNDDKKLHVLLVAFERESASKTGTAWSRGFAGALADLAAEQLNQGKR